MEKTMEREKHLNKIREADKAYYDNAAPIMEDEEYDAFRNDYIKKYGIQDLEYVPGSTITSRKFGHPVEVISLGKVEIDDVKRLEAEIKRLSPIVVEPKYDGITVVAYPKEDGSYFFVTRGNGQEGDILPWFPYDGLRGKNNRYAIRGEAYMTQKSLNKMNEKLIENGEEPKANPRNAVAGILNPTRKEKSPFLKYVQFACYDVIGYDMSETDKIDFIIRETPFTSADYIVIGSNRTFESAQKDIRYWWENLRREDFYPIDGLVIAYNKTGGDKKFGSTGHHIKRKIAVKFPQKFTMTTLRRIEWQLGKTGALTPIAVFDPIEILGSTISKASLSNPDEIRRLNLQIGDKIGVIKAREIIPKIVSNLYGGKEEIIVPSICPSCGTSLKKYGPILKCGNEFCREKIVQKIVFLAGKNVLNIPGLSEETARKIVDSFNQMVLAMFQERVIFELKVEDIIKLPGFAEKSAQKLYDSIQNAKKNVPLPRFIKALCIEGIGEDIGRIVRDKYHDLRTMENYLAPYKHNRERNKSVLELEGIGEKTAKILTSDKFWKAVQYLYDYIIPIDEPNLKKKTGYEKKVFALTGKMPQPREYYVKIIEEAGGKVVNSISGRTNYLVIADSDSRSTKAKKARELGVQFIAPELLEHMFKKEE